jgi:hypothetical protein
MGKKIVEEEFIKFKQLLILPYNDSWVDRIRLTLNNKKQS